MPLSEAGLKNIYLKHDLEICMENLAHVSHADKVL